MVCTCFGLNKRFINMSIWVQRNFLEIWQEFLFSLAYKNIYTHFTHSFLKKFINEAQCHFQNLNSFYCSQIPINNQCKWHHTYLNVGCPIHFWVRYHWQCQRESKKGMLGNANGKLCRRSRKRQTYLKPLFKTW